MKIRQIEVNLDERVETGPVQFNNDWPGVFIRGDDCLAFITVLKFYLDHSHPNNITPRSIASLVLDAIKSATGIGKL